MQCHMHLTNLRNLIFNVDYSFYYFHTFCSVMYGLLSFLGFSEKRKLQQFYEIVTRKQEAYTSLDSTALINKNLVLVENFICGKVSKLFFHVVRLQMAVIVSSVPCDNIDLPVSLLQERKWLICQLGNHLIMPHRPIVKLASKLCVTVSLLIRSTCTSN